MTGVYPLHAFMHKPGNTVNILTLHQTLILDMHIACIQLSADSKYLYETVNDSHWDRTIMTHRYWVLASLLRVKCACVMLL
jgi:hypothetical protein